MSNQPSHEYYIGQSPTSDPGQYVYLFDNLPTDLAGIAKVTQGLVYHYFWEPPQERLPEINTRSMDRIQTLLSTEVERYFCC